MKTSRRAQIGKMYEEKHRYFVQHMLKNGSVSRDKAFQFLNKINAGKTCILFCIQLIILKFVDIEDLASLKNFIIEINEEVAAHGFKIVCVNCEVTGEALIIWLNFKNDHLNKLQNTFSAIELEYFQIIMREIILAKERCLLYSFSANLSTTLTTPIPKTDAFKLLSKWIKIGYLVNKEGRIYLGARCILEFSPYFLEHCGEHLLTCSLCSEMVIKVGKIKF